LLCFLERKKEKMAVKDCGRHKGCKCERHWLYRKCCAALLAFILLALFVILVVWLVLRPHKPRFYLWDLLHYTALERDETSKSTAISQ
jgi:hypothetical protein